MRVLVLGGGVIGVTSAWYLAEAGHEVTVVDREAGPALGTSFANAGQISLRLRVAVGGPRRAAEGHQADVFQEHAPLSIRPDGTLFSAVQWMWQMLQNPQRRTLRRQQGTHGSPGRIQPRLHPRVARRHRHCL
ncbi:FAD-dependent oxidoreductase [Cupriavidus basilensis]